MLPDQYELLSQPHDQASLGEHFELALLKQRHSQPLVSELLKFFGLEDAELTLRELRYPLYELPNLHRGIARRFANWSAVYECGGLQGYSRSLWAPIYQRWEVRPRRFRSYLLRGCRMFVRPDGSKLALLFDQDYDPPMVECTMIAPRDDVETLRREAAELSRWMKRHHYLRGQALRANGTLLRKTAVVNWDDIALATAVRASLEENTTGLLRRRGEFRANGVPLRRGILLYGPPGTGKTMVGKALSQCGAATFIWVTAADFAALENLRSVFRLARLLKPTIIFLEDLDLYAAERGGSSSATLGELLSQMDGLEQNDGLIVVATTNDLTAIEPALRDRPSRFDVVLEVGLPDHESRRRILAQRLKRQDVASETLSAAAAATTGMSGAQICEVAFLAVQLAILRGSSTSGGVAQPTVADIHAAIERVTGKRHQAIGFTASTARQA